MTTIVVEHRDRLARFGVEYVQAALEADGPGLLVVDPGEVDGDLVGDVRVILTWLCPVVRHPGRCDPGRPRRGVATGAVEVDSS